MKEIICRGNEESTFRRSIWKHSFFLQFKQRIAGNYPELFEEGNESGNEYSAQANFGRKWNWYQSIYGLAQGDVTRFDNITELGLFKCLTYLAFEKEKLQLEKNLIKRK